VVPTHGLPLLLHAGLDVVVVPPALKGPRHFNVMSCVDARGGQLIALEGIQSIGQAAKLVGKTLLARVADLPRDYMLHDVDGLVGREVVDATRGLLGEICEVMRGPAHDVWVVRGGHGEVLIPVVESMVRAWEKDGPVMVDLPRGLVKEDADGTL